MAPSIHNVVHDGAPINQLGHDNHIDSRCTYMVKMRSSPVPDPSIVYTILCGDNHLFNLLLGEDHNVARVTVEAFFLEKINAHNTKDEHYQRSDHHEGENSWQRNHECLQ